MEDNLSGTSDEANGAEPPEPTLPRTEDELRDIVREIMSEDPNAPQDLMEVDRAETNDEAHEADPPEERTLPRTSDELREMVREIVSEDAEVVQENDPDEDAATRQAPVRELVQRDQLDNELRVMIRDIIADEASQPELAPYIVSDEEIPTATPDSRELPTEERELPRSDDELRQIAREIVAQVLADVAEQKAALAERMPRGLGGRIRRIDVPFTPKQLYTAAAVALVVLVGGLVYYFRPRNEPIPDELVGLWTTTAEDYADRAFRITKNTITFHTAADDSTFHLITRVQSRDEGIARLFTVNYEWYEEEYEFAFFYVRIPNRVIRFRNQRNMVWRKSGV